MGKAYSDDLRRKVLETREQGEGTLEDLAKRFRVSLSWTKKISAAYSLTGRMERPTGAKRGRKSKVTPEFNGFLQAAVAAQADLTLAGLKGRLSQEKKLEICIGWLWSTVKRLELRFKKTLHATEQDSERVQKLRAEFWASISRGSAENIIFLDESGTTTEMIRRYGRGPIGVGVPDSAPGSWRTPTLLGASASTDGLLR